MDADPVQIPYSDLTPQERRQVWELMKSATGLSDQELLAVLEADARDYQANQ